MNFLPKRKTAITAKFLKSLVDSTPRTRAVLGAFSESKRIAPTFHLSSGLLPEVSESCSARLFDVVQHISGRHLGGGALSARLRRSLRKSVKTPEALDRIDSQITAQRASDITAAYVFGLSVGLAHRPQLSTSEMPRV